MATAPTDALEAQFKCDKRTDRDRDRDADRDRDSETQMSRDRETTINCELRTASG